MSTLVSSSWDYLFACKSSERRFRLFFPLFSTLGTSKLSRQSPNIHRLWISFRINLGLYHRRICQILWYFSKKTSFSLSSKTLDLLLNSMPFDWFFEILIAVQFYWNVWVCHPCSRYFPIQILWLYHEAKFH